MSSHDIRKMLSTAPYALWLQLFTSFVGRGPYISCWMLIDFGLFDQSDYSSYLVQIYQKKCSPSLLRYRVAHSPLHKC